uniref:Uncharacterized protein n=1 Tax=Panagrolaimus davidi TaxID=227884 RepID=A0A914PLE7_9BILA
MSKKQNNVTVPKWRSTGSSNPRKEYPASHRIFKSLTNYKGGFDKCPDNDKEEDGSAFDEPSIASDMTKDDEKGAQQVEVVETPLTSEEDVQNLTISSNRQHLKNQQSDDAQIVQQLYNEHLSDQGVKKQMRNNTRTVRKQYSSRSSLEKSNNHLNDTINSQRSYSSYGHIQPVLLHSLNYAISMHDFLKRTWIDLPELKSEITDFGLHAQLKENAEKMEISKLTSCQSILMTLFFAGDRSLDFIVHAPHLSGVTVGVAFCMVNYVMDYKEYDHTIQKSLAPMM